MDYQTLMQGIEYSGSLPQGMATGAAQDSRKVTPGIVFVCIQGRGVDGHDYAAQALQKGAGLIVTQRPLGLEREVVVGDTRAAYAQICQNFFGRPAEKLSLIAVTGTNGKTTVANVIKQALEEMGLSCGFIGTLGNQIGNVMIPAKYTTPEAWDMAALLSRMAAAGCTHVVMEASSQALEQGRLGALHFDLGIFTNLSRDHLDYHGDMEGYFACKKTLFAHCDRALINWDDDYGRRLLSEKLCGTTYSFSTRDNQADFTAHGIKLAANGVRFGFLQEGMLFPLKFAMPGEYSVANALCATAACVILGKNAQEATEAMGRVKGVPGRCEVLYSGQFTVLRDFAHTGDGMEKLLSSLRPFVEGRMIVLFGCAGERDASKRPAMGQAAASYGDVIYITADNPRSEPVQQTIQDALQPIVDSQKTYVTEPNRRFAINQALEKLQAGDLLVLCGKGHEDYQALDGWTEYLDESQIVGDWLVERGIV